MIEGLKTSKSFFFGSLLLMGALSAQTINCNYFYWNHDANLYAFDPIKNESILQPVKMPYGSTSFGIGQNLNQKAGGLTFYTSVSGEILYHDGNSWVKSGHKGCEHPNHAGSTHYLFMLDDNDIFRYDGKSDAHWLVEIPNYSGPWDLFCDKLDNFYLVNIGREVVLQYDYTGKLLQEFPMKSLTGAQRGGGVAYANNTIYLGDDMKVVPGTCEKGMIEFSLEMATPLPEFLHDCGSCPIDRFELGNCKNESEATIDTLPVVNEVVFTENNIPVSIKDRLVELQSTITVDQSEFDIEIWDLSVVDGDSISLNLNGNWILEGYSVLKTKLRMHIKVNPNSPNNYLILYALNLGEISPNTAALQVLVDGKEYKLTLTSDLKKSGALNFSYVPK